MDGVTVGHPCCNEQNCKEPLAKVFDEFCLAHEAMAKVCAVKDCHNLRGSGFRTCALTEHRGEEKRRKDKATKKRRRDASTNEGPTQTAGKKLPGSFSRKWTHNEQLMVRLCGIVIGRATFYTSEAISAVRVRAIVSSMYNSLQSRIIGFHRQCLPP